ncbi:hypothetical protein F5Y19DRAFT_460875 [Xylariaceae sp. FL1651]|nr:hypothetical protein F5Y19DRAFT_460875 [Xylariaceae sp. FL1651]
MTTGRINQVTIVRRGWPTAPCDAEELVTVEPLGQRPNKRQLSGQGKARHAVLPSNFPL